MFIEEWKENTGKTRKVKNGLISVKRLVLLTKKPESLPKNYSRQRSCWIYKCTGVLWTGDPGVKKGQATPFFCKEMH